MASSDGKDDLTGLVGEDELNEASSSNNAISKTSENASKPPTTPSKTADKLAKDEKKKVDADEGKLIDLGEISPDEKASAREKAEQEMEEIFKEHEEKEQQRKKSEEPSGSKTVDETDVGITKADMKQYKPKKPIKTNEVQIVDDTPVRQQLEANERAWDDEEPGTSAQDSGMANGNAQRSGMKGDRLIWTQSTGRITFLAVASILLGTAILCVATGSLLIVHTSPSHQSVQIESKWINVIMIFSGLTALWAIKSHTMASLCCCLMFSICSSATAGITTVVSAINIYLRSMDRARHQYSGNYQSEKTSSVLADLNVYLTILGLASTAVSMLLFRTILHVAGKNWGYSVHVDKHRLRLSLFGLTQIIIGMMSTTWWTAIELFSQGRNSGMSGLPTSELLTHGMIFVCTGYVQMMATSKGIAPLLTITAVLNCISLFFCTYFYTRPFATMYFIIQQSYDFFSIAFMDGRIWVALLLILFYTAQLTINVYSVIKFTHLAAGNRVHRIDNMLHKWRSYLSTMSYAQFGIGGVYAFFEMIAFGAFFLYKLDFNPLCIYIILSGVFARAALRMGSLMMLTICSALCMCSAVFALEDIYLFAYHIFSHETPDEMGPKGGVAQMTGARLFTHFGLAVCALIEILTAAFLIYVILRVLMSCVRTTVDKADIPHTLSILRITTFIQFGCQVFILIGGLVLFLNRSFYLEKFGDISLMVGLLFVVANGFVFAYAVRTQNIGLLPALGGMLCALACAWQLLDTFVYFLHDFLVSNMHRKVVITNTYPTKENIDQLRSSAYRPPEDQPAYELVDIDTTGLVIAALVYVVVLAAVLAACVQLLCLAAVLQASTLEKHDVEPERSSELLEANRQNAMNARAEQSRRR